MTASHDEDSSLFPHDPTAQPSGRVKRKKKQRFKEYRQEDAYLLPRQTSDYIGPGHIARLISRVVDAMDQSALRDGYRGGGRSAYDPGMLLKVWLLGYATRTYTSRTLAKALRENVAFMWISGHQTPDFRTLNRFRSRLKESIHELFRQLTYMGLEIGVIRGEEIVVDHTKMEADANRHKMVWRKTVEKRSASIERELEELFETIDQLNVEEESAYGERDFAEQERDGFSEEDVARLVQSVNAKLKIVFPAPIPRRAR